MRSKNDRQKLLDAGFTILRVDNESILLKYMQDRCWSWKVWKKFITKAEMEREIKRIDALEPKIIIE
jgi:hypothetical protein